MSYIIDRDYIIYAYIYDLGYSPSLSGWGSVYFLLQRLKETFYQSVYLKIFSWLHLGNRARTYTSDAALSANVPTSRSFPFRPTCLVFYACVDFLFATPSKMVSDDNTRIGTAVSVHPLGSVCLFLGYVVVDTGCVMLLVCIVLYRLRRGETVVDQSMVEVTCAMCGVPTVQDVSPR